MSGIQSRFCIHPRIHAECGTTHLAVPFPGHSITMDKQNILHAVAHFQYTFVPMTLDHMSVVRKAADECILLFAGILILQT